MSSSNNSTSHHKTKGVVRAKVVDADYLRADDATIDELYVTTISGPGAPTIPVIPSSEYIWVRSLTNGPFIVAGGNGSFAAANFTDPASLYIRDPSNIFEATSDNTISCNGNRTVSIHVVLNFQAELVTGTTARNFNVSLRVTQTTTGLPITTYDGTQLARIGESTPDVYTCQVAVLDFGQARTGPATTFQIIPQIKEVDDNTEDLSITACVMSVMMTTSPITG